MDKPKPVPSPTCLVVKKGSKILLKTASDIPEPVSEIAISIKWSCVSKKLLIVKVPCCGMA